jgi:hypothetical protein
MDTVAVCAIFKNEARYLMEWIGFHRMIGVDHFVLYDNGSTDGGPTLIRSSPFARHVTLIDWPMRAGQIPAYADFAQRHAQRFTWAAVIDLDEFIHPLESDTLRPLLPRYHAFSAVLLHWMVFGPSGHEASPSGLVIGNYTRRLPADAPVNQHVKSLLRTRDLVSAHTTPHIFTTSGPVCNARGETVPSHARLDPACHAGLVVNHYLTKSAEDWRRKAARGKADEISPADNAYRDKQFNDVLGEAHIEDQRMARFIPRLRWVLRDAQAVPAECDAA